MQLSQLPFLFYGTSHRPHTLCVKSAKLTKNRRTWFQDKSLLQFPFQTEKARGKTPCNLLDLQMLSNMIQFG